MKDLIRGNVIYDMKKDELGIGLVGAQKFHKIMDAIFENGQMKIKEGLKS